MYILTNKTRMSIRKQIRDRYYIFDSVDGSCIHISTESLEALIKKGVVIKGIETNKSPRVDDWHFHAEKVVVNAEDVHNFQSYKSILRCKLNITDNNWEFILEGISRVMTYVGQVNGRYCVHYDKCNMDYCITEEQKQMMLNNAS